MQPIGTNLSSFTHAMQPAGASQLKAPKSKPPKSTSSQTKKPLFSKSHLNQTLFQFPPNTTFFFFSIALHQHQIKVTNIQQIHHTLIPPVS